MNSGLIRLDSVRHSLKIDAMGKIRVSFELNAIGNDIDAVFECMSCTDLLSWQASSRVWECPHCGYQLTPAEAGGVVANMRRKLNELSAELDELAYKVETKVGRKWGWVMWLRRLLRLKAA